MTEKQPTVAEAFEALIKTIDRLQRAVDGTPANYTTQEAREKLNSSLAALRAEVNLELKRES